MAGARAVRHAQRPQDGVMRPGKRRQIGADAMRRDARPRLPVQRIPDAQELTVAGKLDTLAMETHRPRGVSLDVAPPRRAVHLPQLRPQRVQFPRRAGHGQLRGSLLDQRPQLVGLPELGGVDGSHAGAAKAFGLHQPQRLHFAQRLAHGRLTDIEVPRQRHLLEAHSRRIASVKNARNNHVADLIAHAASMNHRIAFIRIPFHFTAPSPAVPPATRTACPEAIESGGLMITGWFPARPDNTSTSVPKSRPSVIGSSSTLPFAVTAATLSPPARNSSALAGSLSTPGRGGSLKRTSASAPGSSSPSGLPTSSSTSRVRLAGSMAPAVRTSRPVKSRPGRSTTCTSALMPGTIAAA